MREKARKFVYAKAGNYISYDFLKVFYWCIFIIPFLMIVMSTYLINLEGVSGKALFPIVSIAIWSFLYWGLVLIIKNRHVKKTFELRFLVNGAIGISISSLMWIFFAGWNLIAEQPFLKFHVFIWIIPIYIVVSLLYIVSIVFGVHRGLYVEARTKYKTISVLSTSISISAGLGLIVSRLLRETASIEIQHIAMIIATTILIFVPLLAHINFVKYFYCKKYNIKCDVNGNTMSPDLQPVKNDKSKAKNQWKNQFKQTACLKNFLTLLGVLIIIAVVFCIANFAKGFIHGFLKNI